MNISTSSRKRPTASPAESGSSRAPGPSISQSNKFLRSKVLHDCQSVNHVYTPAADVKMRANSLATMSPMSVHTFGPARASPLRLSKNARVSQPVTSGAQ